MNNTNKSVASRLLSVRILSTLMILYGVGSCVAVSVTAYQLFNEPSSSISRYAVAETLPLYIQPVVTIILGLVLALSKSTRTVSRVLTLMVALMALVIFSTLLAPFLAWKSSIDLATIAPILVSSVVVCIILLHIKGRVRNLP